MLPSCGSLARSNLLFENNIFHTIFNRYSCEISQRKPQLAFIINYVLDLIFIQVYESCQHTSKKYHIFAIFILNIVFLNCSLLLKYIANPICFKLFGILHRPLFMNQKRLSGLLNFSQIFSKKEIITTKKRNKNTKQTIFSYREAIIAIILFGLINKLIFKRLDDPKPLIDAINTKVKFYEKSKNLSIVHPLWLNDNQIISVVRMECESVSINQGRSYVDQDIDISRCFFSRYLSYSGDGGVIYVNGGSYSMNINYSMFFYCLANNYGAIWFSSSVSYLRMVCANRCSASSGQFAYLIASQVNHVEFLSVSYCSHEASGYNSIYLNSGNQRVDNTNSSMNNVIMGSGILIYFPSSFASSHCTFSNNKVSDGICIYFKSDSGIITLLFANIVHNNSPNYGVILADNTGSRKMKYCIFHSNQNYLFCERGGSFEVSHSFIYHSSSFSRSTPVSTVTNNTFTNVITYQIPFFSSLHCNADIPLIESNRKYTIDQTQMKYFYFVYSVTILIIS